MLSVVSWINPAGGAWEVGGNWSNGACQGAGDDAVINMPGISVTHSTGSDTVKSLTLNDAFTLSGGTLTIVGSGNVQEQNSSVLFALSGGTLAGGTVVSGTTITAKSNGGNTLSGVTFNGVLDLATNNNAIVNVTGGLTLNGTILVGRADGSTYGTVAFQGTQPLSGSGNVLFGGSGVNTLGLTAEHDPDDRGPA